ncbi:MAG: endonuclease/exonuclease/phosphatase family protein [Winogradskyella sp.]|uniref:endonuclease/exonuclease/phosphatase family protein n=1 Tax=Winogradskyella sp. TaxID=1883156 RepID=UPI0025D1CA3E|nr:endonuclease/exonuclease/phosphatase family protein [Winogradskyella sp.]NRB83032.1 endonuclease/exonuclease/phosphatase family protein [Winogradskyella sp.]
MKKMKFFGSLVFFVNSLAAFLLLISYILPYIPPKSFSSLSVLSLSVPLLIIINAFFFVYWVLRLRKQLLLSLFVLALGWNHVGSLYKFSSSEPTSNNESMSVLSFNVRLFNEYKWLPSETIKEDIVKLIQTESPEIVCLQEYRRGNPVKLDGYYNFNATYTKETRGGQVIYSKFPIINSGSLEFQNTNNNAIFADIVKQKDTIRVYNMHLQSARINTEHEEISTRTSGSLFKRVGRMFKAQQEQVELFKKHKSQCPYKVIVTGDFNNTAYSYTFDQITGDDLIDTFAEAGSGFGKTFEFKYFPMRIDFVLADKEFQVNGFKTYNDIKLSDHYPVVATLSLD